MDELKKKFSFQNLQDLKFPGHEVFKSRLPKALQLAEAVAEEWKKDGDFNGLPVGHPITQVALGLGLRKAKDIEKKLDEKGVFTMAQIGLEYAKVQAAKLPMDKLPGPLASFLKKNEEESTATTETESAETRNASTSDEASNETATDTVADTETETEDWTETETAAETVTDSATTEPEEVEMPTATRHKNRNKHGGKNQSRRTH